MLEIIHEHQWNVLALSIRFSKPLMQFSLKRIFRRIITLNQFEIYGITTEWIIIRKRYTQCYASAALYKFFRLNYFNIKAALFDNSDQWWWLKRLQVETRNVRESESNRKCQNYCLQNIFSFKTSILHKNCCLHLSKAAAYFIV